MTRGRSWTDQEVNELKALVEANTALMEISTKLDKSPGAIIVKCRRLGLRLQTTGYTNTTVMLPRELPSVEEDLIMLAGALKAARKPGLTRVEIQRLQVVANIAKTYQDVLANYINYRNIEERLKKMEEFLDRFLKGDSKDVPS